MNKKENKMEIGVYFPSSKQNVSAIETLWIPIAYLIQVDLYMQLWNIFWTTFFIEVKV